MSIQTELQQFRTDMGLTHDWVQGTDTETVQLGDVATPTIRNAVRQFLGSGGIKAYATKAALDSDLSPAANSLAIVTNDSTAANNGYYVKSGGEGEGSWTASDYDPATRPEFDAMEARHGEDISDVSAALLDLRQDVHSSFILPEWPELRSACVDAEWNVLASIDADGGFHDGMAPELATALFIAPDFPFLRHAVMDEDGRIVESVPDILGSSESSAFLQPYREDVRCALLDEDGREIMRVGADGGVAAAGQALNPMPYMEDGALKAVSGTSSTQLARFDSGEIISCAPLNASAVRVAVRRPDGSVAAGTVGVDGVPLPAWDGNTLHCFILTGQSLAVGTYGLDIQTEEAPSKALALMLENSAGTPDIRMGVYYTELDSDTITGFQPVKAWVRDSTRGQTPLEAMAAAVARHELAAGLSFPTLWLVSGAGGRAYPLLKKGTVVYGNVITAVAKAKELAAKRGWSLVVDGILLKHGEADADAGDVDYYNDLIEWQSDYNSDIKAVTGQASDIQFLIGAFSTWYAAEANGGVDGHGPINAMLRAHAEHPGEFSIVSNDYPIIMDCSTDNRHMTGKGYAILGELWARNAMMSACFGCENVVMASSAVRDGTSVELSVSVPFAPLVFDTQTISERSGTRYGIRYFDGESEVAVSAAGIADAGASGTGKIVLTLAEAPSGQNAEKVQIAWDGMLYPRASNQDSIPRANIRDSAGDIYRSSIDGRRLDNWAVPQEITVSIA